MHATKITLNAFLFNDQELDRIHSALRDRAAPEDYELIKSISVLLS